MRVARNSVTAGCRIRLIVSVVALSLVGTGLLATTALAGSTYLVAQCSPGHAGSSATPGGNTSAYEATTGCGSGGHLRVTSVSTAPPLAGRQWVYTAPTGTQFERIRADFGLVGDIDHGGNRSLLFVGDVGMPESRIISEVTSGSLAGLLDTDLDPLGGPYKLFGVGLSCSRAAQPCPPSSHYVRLGGVALTMKDTSTPSVPSLSGPALSGWVRATSQIQVSAADVGAGVYRLVVSVNGVQDRTVTTCSPGADGNGYVTSMNPCPASTSESVPITTAGAPFHDGPDNTVQVCAFEYGADPASRCAQREVKVDNVAPEEPQGLELVGADGWRRSNDFDLRWSNPSQEHAPIAGAVVRLTGPGGYDESTTYSEADIEEIENLSVPGPGVYEAHVRLLDAAGNSSPANAATVELKFDDTVPPGVEAEKANGWLSRDELVAGYLQRWQVPEAELRPPSGIAGYRTVVDRHPNTDPCAGGADFRACGGPITEIGVLTNTRELGLDDVAEGENYVHVVPVSGSGMRAAEVGHAVLPVDLTPPLVKADGVPDGWGSEATEVVIRAEDAVSGMEIDEEFAGGAPPITVAETDGEIFEGGDEVVVPIEEGVHEIRHWARDLAGNVSDPSTTTVRIDETDPVVSFAAAQDPDDPDQLVAHATDALSGVVDGSISYRRVDRDGWQQLDTDLVQDTLVAHADSASMVPGVTYEFRARAVDAAGNVAISDSRSDGSPMRVVGPFKSITKIDELRINGSRTAQVKLGRRATLTGRITDQGGAGLPGVPISIGQSFAQGSRAKRSTLSVTSGAGGQFRAVLPKGPTREVVAQFHGDGRSLPSKSDPARLKVRSAVVLRAPRRVRAGGRIRFRGRVRAPGAAIPAIGKRVEVQVKVGRRWKTVGRSVRTDRRGAFRLKYRFVASYSRPVRYAFRAVALPESGFPFLPSRSKRRHVIVRP